MKNNKRMQIWLAEILSGKESPDYIEGKYATILANKEQVKELAIFLAQVSEYLESHDYCHMHFRDYNKKWNKRDYFDIAVNVDQRARK